MKYMGSKKTLLANGLGELIIEKSKNAANFYDPFCGSASVVWFASAKIANKIYASDLQSYSIFLANSVLLRTKQYSAKKLINSWLIPVEKKFIDYSRNQKINKNIAGFITKAYGGYYFGYEQAIKFDMLYSCLPEDNKDRTIAIASLIMAASSCVASPGHTAQPFQPTDSALKFIYEAWSRDPFKYVQKAIEEICLMFSNKIGSAKVGDAINILQALKENDLVFLDPPYSGVHYSRFYHVLETIARGNQIKVEGIGRYPKISERPSSKFSMKSESQNALNNLLKLIANKRATAILTFPNHECSNGLSGSFVKEIARKYFSVEKEIIKNSFSTLGGNITKRPARIETEELILTLLPK